jgi:hypothetical protein
LGGAEKAQQSSIQNFWMQDGTGCKKPLFKAVKNLQLSDKIVFMSSAMVLCRLSRILSGKVLDRLWIDSGSCD